MSTSADVNAILKELEALEDPKMRAINEAHGDDHGINLSKLREVAKRLKKQPDLALALWDEGTTPAKLLSTLICKPSQFSEDDLDRMVNENNVPKVHEWLMAYVVKPSKHTEPLRLKWKDQTGNVGRAGWYLTVNRVVKSPEGLDFDALLDEIESDMKTTDERKQWTMNHCLAEIGIQSAEHRERALAIGKKLEVLIDYPTPAGCTSPYAPIWIEEIVRRKSA